LAAAIEELTCDPGLRAQMAGAAARAGARFDITTAVTRIEAIYREVVTR